MHAFVGYEQSGSIQNVSDTGQPRGLEGPRANPKCGAHYIDCARGCGGMPPEKLFSEECSGGS